MCISVICCKSTKLNISTDIIAGSMMTQFNGTFTEVQFDSICKADRIDGNLRNWHKFSYIDFEDRDTIFKYVYIKEYSDMNEVIYILTPMKNGVYSINKRVVTPDEDD